jgi:hypothetical protein
VANNQVAGHRTPCLGLLDSDWAAGIVKICKNRTVTVRDRPGRRAVPEKWTAPRHSQPSGRK